MDNISHSAVGLALGELVERCLPEEADPARARVRRRLLLVTGAAAANFPDLDLLWTPLLDRPLGYLLHHRGLTHTLLYSLPQAAALLALLWLLWPAARQLLRESSLARLATIGTACLGLLLHLTMDYLNVYGIHPYHPFDSRWLYGDLVFIVEPMFWIAFGAPLAVMARRKWVRWLLAALLAGIPLGFAGLGFLHWGSLAGLAVLGGVLAWLQRGSSPRGRVPLVASLAAIVLFVAVQGLAVRSARELVAAEVSRLAPGGRLLDVPLSAFPANPICWNFATIESNEAAGSYRVRRGVLSLAPELLPVSACPAILDHAPVTGGNPGLAWVWQEQGRLASLRELQRTNCHVDAWFRFARAPSLGGGLATDVRFGPPGQPNFSTLPYAALGSVPCPRQVPGWGYPRADLLGLP